MIRVRALQAHGNPRGSAFWKTPGTIYALPENEAAALIAAGLVRPVRARATRARKADDGKRQG
jgi:hypothetical protein